MKGLLLALLACVIVATAGLAQDSDNPTVAFLRLGRFGESDPTDTATLDMLQVYGYINADERAQLNEWRDIQGERLNFIWLDAGNDIANLNFIVERAIDEGADILHTTSTLVSQTAANITNEMDDPPALFFSLVSLAYGHGIASSPCIKPAHVLGVYQPVPYEQILSALQLQQPDMQALGVLVNPAEDLSMDGLEQIKIHAEPLGIAVKAESVATAADLSLATSALLGDGAELIMLSPSAVALLGIPAIAGTANDEGVPIAVPYPPWIDRGAAIGVGYTEYYRDGQHAAAMMIGYLKGEIEIADIGISSMPGLTVALNLDAAEAAGIEFTEDLLAMADWVIEGGASTRTASTPNLLDMPLEERRAEDAEFLESIRCTPERIAEEQAALDAAQS